MDNAPLVSIICCCYNQADFVEEALKSVIHQTYKNTQIIVIDDFSTDNSVEKIESLKLNNDVVFIKNDHNLGLCAAFNIGLALAKGKYIVDFSCDDIMLPERIQIQVEFFEAENNAGLIYSNAEYIDVHGNFLKPHFGENSKLTPYSGNVYEKVIAEYFIPTPTMMFRADVLKALNGYDENLAYEDFDIWVRIARNHTILYQNETLVKIRKSKNSLSSKWYKKHDLQAHSTYLVCEKIATLNKSKSETIALVKRIEFELRQCFRNKLKTEFNLHYALLNKISKPKLFYKALRFWFKFR